MSELMETLRAEFQDEEYRHSYAEECLNTMIATQIKVLREQRKMTQEALAEKTGMKQPRLSVMEDANYSSWSINTLKRLARAFDVALAVKFEAFSDVILDFESLSRASLERPSFEDDVLFQSNKVTSSAKFRKHPRKLSDAERSAMQGDLLTMPLLEWPVRQPASQMNREALRPEKGVSPTARNVQTEKERVALRPEKGEVPTTIAAQNGGTPYAISISSAG